VIRLSLAAAWIAFLCSGRGFRFDWRPLDLPAALFPCWALLTSAWAPYPWVAWQFSMNLLVVSAAYFLLRWIPGEGEECRWVDAVLAALLIGASVHAIAVFLDKASGASVRPGGLLTNPNYAVDLLAFGIAAGFAVLSRVRSGISPVARFSVIGAIVMCAAAIILTRSRAILPVGAVILGYATLFFRMQRRWLFPVAVVALSLAGIFLADRFSGADPYAMTRLTIWKAAVAAVADHPAGYGLGGFRFAWLEYREPVLSGMFRYLKTAHTAHSQLFSVLAELGWPGLFLSIAAGVALVRLIVIEMRRDDRIPGLCIVPLAAITHAVIDVNFDLLGIALSVAAVAALLVNRNAPRSAEPAPSAPLLRYALGLPFALTIAYGAATCIAFVVYSNGLDALRAGRLEDAFRGFALARSLDRPSAVYPDALSSVWYRRYLAGRNGEDLLRAAALEREASEASPSDPCPLSQEGFLLSEHAEASPDPEVRLRSRQEALSLYDQGLTKSPHDIVLQQRKVDLLERMGRKAEAREALERLLETEPNFAGGHVRLADTLSGDDPEAARRHYRQALDIVGRARKRTLESLDQKLLAIDVQHVESRLAELGRRGE
jgi:tetratricopeptide (TPR) repeat protein/O-antigen ligase